MDDVRRRLDDLKAARRSAAHAPPRRATPVSSRLDDVLGGHEIECQGRRCWLVETPLIEVCAEAHVGRWDLSRGLRDPTRHATDPIVEPPRTMVLDIETGGFAGMPVFLIGVVLLDRQPLRVDQYLARDYPEEEAILRAFAEVAAQRDTWVTFNGRSFDEPFLRDRAILHRVPLASARLHIDLLHAARRQWRHALPNCRLGTLEEHVLRRPRIGDVPSSDVPDLFHHFIRTGNAGPLGPVLEHTRLDLVACTELLVRLGAVGH